MRTNDAARNGIFICYRQKDAGGFAGRLHGALESAGYEAFLDVTSIRSGEEFQTAISNRLTRCSTVLVLIGHQWLTIKSESGEQRRLDEPYDPVRLEIELSLQQHGLNVIPVLLDGARLPTERELPPSIRSLARKQACELTNKRWKYDFAELCKALPPVPKRRRTLTAIGALVAALLAATIALRYGTTPPGPSPDPTTTTSVTTSVPPDNVRSIATTVEMQKGNVPVSGSGATRVGDAQGGVVTYLTVKMSPPELGLVLMSELFGMEDTGRSDGGGPIMRPFSGGPMDASDVKVFPKGIKGARFWLKGTHAAKYQVQYQMKLTTVNESSGRDGEKAGDWNAAEGSSQHQLIWLSISIVPRP